MARVYVRNPQVLITPNRRLRAVTDFAEEFKLSTSLVPSTGEGVLTNNRATKAWMWRDADGRTWRDYAAGRTLIECAAGEQRFEGARRDDAGVYYGTLSDGTPIPANEIAAVVESQATNIFTYSEDLTHANWGKIAGGTGSTPITTMISPGITRLQCLLNGGTTSDDKSYVQQVSGLAQYTERRMQVLLKSNTGVAQNVHVRNGLSVSSTAIARLDWTLFTSLSSAASTDTSCFIGTRGAHGSSNTLDILIRYVQIENVTALADKSPSTYIPTTTASATRNADALALTGYTIPDTAGTLYFEAEANDWTAPMGQLVGDRTEYLLKPITTNSGIQAFDGTNTALGPVGTPLGMLRFAVRWGDGKMRLSVNGTLGNEVNYDGSWNLLQQLVADGFNGLVRNLRIWERQLTDQQLQKVTQ